ncbi:MAG: efflux RND transporter permease subunit [Desulfobacteraceae bacterium]|nr:efflux RND transporter permease subunit [Desulfobacteraceae bacterium]
MNFAKLAIEKKVITIVMTLVMLGAGIICFTKLGMLEDPEFTIKEALVITPYKGASAHEVEDEVTDKLELAIQQMGQLKKVTSRSEPGLSTITVEIQNNYDKTTLPQVWDELRRKVNDSQISLPPGTGPSIVYDDYGDVYGIFLAITGDEYSYAELKEYVKMLRRELLLVQDVAKIDTYGMRDEAVYIELDRDRMAQLGVPPSAIQQAVQAKNMVADAGMVRVGTEFITIVATGTFTKVKQFEDLLIPIQGSEKTIRLKDIATIFRGYVDPQTTILRYDGRVGIGIGISTRLGGNAVVMGEAVQKRLNELKEFTPMGIKISSISYQSNTVTKAISGFMINLVEAVVIVIVVLMLFMGFRSAAIIGFVLVVTICATFILMLINNVALERISLGALIIALGMLVDNAIVVIDGMGTKIKQGVDPKKAAISVVKQTGMPLAGATAVAILAFAAIGTSDDSTGEFCRSLYQIILYSLSLSWLTAVTMTPLLGVMFLKQPKKKEGESPQDPYDAGFFKKYKTILRFCIRFKWVTAGIVAIMFIIALLGFGKVKQSFFPESTRPQFMVGFWLPQGTHISETQKKVGKIEIYLKGLDHVTHVTSLVGKGGLRFILTYAPELTNSAYAQFLVDVDDYRAIDDMMLNIETYLIERFPDSRPKVEKFAMGSAGPKVELRISGPQADTLRELSSAIIQMIADTGLATCINTDWEQRVKNIRVVLAETQANLNGITKPDVAKVLKQAFELGQPVGLFRDKDELLPIIIRASKKERTNIDSINNLSIWSPKAGKMIPLRQVVARFETVFEDDIIWRRNRVKTITVKAEPKIGLMTNQLQSALMTPVADFKLPREYFMEWGGEYESSADAQTSLFGSIPVVFLIMVLVVISLFNAIKQPLIIFLCVPLSLIGVTAGLLLTNQPFGFMAILGILSLSGMLIKNAIVLIDEIDLQIGEGKQALKAVVDSSASRLIPVGMAASTTALGMAPLILDAFFISMAVTIIAGLIFASVLTMIFVPVLYTLFFKIKA